MVKYFKRQRQDGTIFFVDEKGNVVDDATAKRNLSESKGTGHRVAELTESRQKDLETVAAEFKRRGLSEAEARSRAVELVESTQRRTQKNELQTRLKLTRTRLEEAFKRSGMFGGMSDAEARIAAKGR